MGVVKLILLLFGVAELIVGIISMVCGRDVLASLRQAPSAYVGVAHVALGIGAILVAALTHWATREQWS